MSLRCLCSGHSTRLTRWGREWKKVGWIVNGTGVRSVGLDNVAVGWRVSYVWFDMREQVDE